MRPLGGTLMKLNISFDLDVQDTTHNETELLQLIQKIGRWLNEYLVLLLEKKMEYVGKGTNKDDPLIIDLDEKIEWAMKIPNNLKIENKEFVFTHKEPGFVEHCLIKRGANINEA